MLDKEWFINEITKIDVHQLSKKGKLKAIVTVHYGIFGLKGFRVYQKEEDGELITWVKAPCFNDGQYSEVPYLNRKYKDLWFKWMGRIRDKYLKQYPESSEELTEEAFDRVTQSIEDKTKSYV